MCLLALSFTTDRHGGFYWQNIKTVFHITVILKYAGFKIHYNFRMGRGNVGFRKISNL
jgi:hypothetical protein